ncbi:MAG: hypothetical protein C0522_07690 [Rhodocyclaceae bacterium]|jgi:hypothetical protein|nr:hypothetical protein [Rhodocyclaceae bacterium]
MNRKFGIAATLIAAGLMFTNAASAGEAVLGAAIGGGAGAVVGHSIGGRGGALVGGALGAAAGVAIGGDHHRAYVVTAAPPVHYYEAPVVVAPLAPIVVGHRSVYYAGHGGYAYHQPQRRGHDRGHGSGHGRGHDD